MPENPDDFFNGTEIDEMRALRIMTMTEEEQRDMSAVDDRACALLQRTESLAREQLVGLHKGNDPNCYLTRSGSMTDSLQEYIVVAQDRAHIEQHIRQDEQ